MLERYFIRPETWIASDAPGSEMLLRHTSPGSRANIAGDIRSNAI